MTRIFIDGSAGTTGLRIASRLSERADLQLITLPEEKRKDPAARLEAYRAADVAFLCLPDDAAREAAEMAADLDTILIDTSTAHRVDPNWVYGMAELPGQRERIARAKRIANPGCHATGFILLTAPLVKAGLIHADARLSCFSLTGYSGGGKKMIEQYEHDDDPLLGAPRMYGLNQSHKHLPEMACYSGLVNPPVFCPVVAPYLSGMEVVIGLTPDQFKGGLEDLAAVYTDAYKTPLVHFDGSDSENGFVSAGAFAGRDDLSVTVYGQAERMVLTARFDNLGKGASGAAIQNMNLALGLPETTGLVL